MTLCVCGHLELLHDAIWKACGICSCDEFFPGMRDGWVDVWYPRVGSGAYYRAIEDVTVKGEYL